VGEEEEEEEEEEEFFNHYKNNLKRHAHGEERVHPLFNNFQ